MQNRHLWFSYLMFQFALAACTKCKEQKSSVLQLKALDRGPASSGRGGVTVGMLHKQ